MVINNENPLVYIINMAVIVSTFFSFRPNVPEFALTRQYTRNAI